MGTRNTRTTSAIAPIDDALGYSYDDYNYGVADNSSFDVYGNLMRNDGGLFSNLSNSDLIDGIGGFGQLGLGFMNYLDNKKVRKAQVAGLNEQVASSKYARGAHKNFVSGTQSAFGV